MRLWFYEIKSNKPTESLRYGSIHFILCSASTLTSWLWWGVLHKVLLSPCSSWLMWPSRTRCAAFAVTSAERELVFFLHKPQISLLNSSPSNVFTQGYWERLNLFSFLPLQKALDSRTDEERVWIQVCCLLRSSYGCTISLCLLWRYQGLWVLSPTE